MRHFLAAMSMNFQDFLMFCRQLTSPTMAISIEFSPELRGLVHTHLIDHYRCKYKEVRPGKSPVVRYQLMIPSRYYLQCWWSIELLQDTMLSLTQGGYFDSKRAGVYLRH